MSQSTLGLATVRFGLRLMQLGLLSFAFAVLLNIVLSFTEAPTDRETLVLMQLILGFGLPGVLFCFGSFPVMAAPTGSGAKKYGLLVMLFAHMYLLLCAFALPFLFLIFPVIMAACAGVLFHVFFVIFLSRLSRLAGRSDLERIASQLLIGIIVVPVALGMLSGATMVIMPQLRTQTLGVVWGIAGLFYTMRYVLLISAICGALRNMQLGAELEVEQHAATNVF